MVDQVDQPRRVQYDLRVDQVNLYEAKVKLSALVERAAAGEEIVIAKAGKPRARLVPLDAAAPRVPGRGKGRIRILAGFDDPLPGDLVAAFGGD